MGGHRVGETKKGQSGACSRSNAIGGLLYAPLIR